jgi:hypothetical protein
MFNLLTENDEINKFESVNTNKIRTFCILPYTNRINDKNFVGAIWDTKDLIKALKEITNN